MRAQHELFTLSYFVIASVLVSVLVSASPAFADDLSTLSFGGEAELYAPIPLESATSDGDRLRVRSVEFTTQTDFDDWWPGLNGKLTFGAEDDTGDFVFNVREGFLSAIDLGLKGFDVRVGKFYLPIGILNQQRKSAWSFESSPQALQLFFTDKGVDDSGVDLSYHSGHFQVHAGGTNGFRFDSSVTNSGNRPETPTHFFRPEVRTGWAEASLVIAANYIGRVDDQGETTRISGLDLNFHSSDDPLTAWHAQTEAYHRYQNPNNGLALAEDLGGYIFAEKGLGRKFLTGLRLDSYTVLSLTNSTGDHRKNWSHAISPVVTYRGRDHLRFQAEYTLLQETRDGNSLRSEQVIELRVVSEFGDLPRSRTPNPDTNQL